MIPLVGLALVAVQIERPAIEQELTGRAQKALAASGAHWAAVNFSGRDVTVTGNAISDNEPDEAVAVLRALWGVGTVKSDAGLPKLANPYVWSAGRRGDRVRLKGHYPNRDMRQTIIGMTRASVPGLELVNAMTPARGAPETDTWLAGVSFALKQLAALRRGEVRLEGLALTISGAAENAESYRALTASLKRGLPKGITLASVQIAAPVVSPFTWSAEFAGGQLMLSGYVASESARTELLAAARAAVAADVIDRMEVAGGAPASSAEAVAAMVKAIVRLQSGSAEMKDAALVVGGVASDEAQAQAVRDALHAALPATFKLTDQIRVKEPKVEPKPEPKVETKSAELPPPVASEAPKDVASPVPSAPAPEEKKAEAPSAESPSPAAEKGTDAAALLTPPVAPPEPPLAAEKVTPPPAPPEAVVPAPAEEKHKAEKEASVAEGKPVEPTPPPKTEDVAPPPKVEPPPAVVADAEPPKPEAVPPKDEPGPPKVDLAACRADLASLAGTNPVRFQRGSAEIGRAALKALDDIARAIKACPGVLIAVEGHTDIEGSPDYNQRLSVKRANVVAEYLIRAGVAADAMQTAGFGTSRPVAPNTSRLTRAKNRRAEIVVRP